MKKLPKMNRVERKQHQTIAAGLRHKKCKCKWVFVTVGIDRTKFKGDCKLPCKPRDEVLRRLNSG